MSKGTSLRIIFVIAICGMLFSGYLSYLELFAQGCSVSPIKCGSEFTLFDLPACVYGFFMYLTIIVVSSIGILSKGISQSKKFSE